MYGEKQKNGLLSESMVSTELLRRNIPFSIPYGSFNEYDLVVETSSGFKAIQVKTCYWDNSKNRFVVSLCTTHRMGGKTLKNKKYKSDSFDYLIAVCHNPISYYIIPIEKVAGRRSLTLYPSGVPQSSVGNPRYERMDNLESFNGSWEQLL